VKTVGRRTQLLDDLRYNEEAGYRKSGNDSLP
jgi:hypothetical protein